MTVNGAGSPVDARSITVALLSMMRREIRERLQPELTSSYALFTADALGQLLDFLEDWTGGAPYADIDAARVALTGATARSHRLVADLDDYAAVDETIEQKVAQAAAAGDRGELARLAKSIGGINAALYDAETHRHAQARAAALASFERIDIELTPARVEYYAVNRLGLAADPVRSIARIPGGNSKDTFLVGFDSGLEWVVRRDFPVGPTEASAPDDFDVLHRLADHGMPVPRPIAAECDPQYFGQPFLIMEKIAGDNALTVAKTDLAAGRFVSFGLARLLAELHRIDPAALGLATVSGTAQEQVAAYVASWRRWWNMNRVHPSSLMEAAFAFLDTNIPTDIPRIVAVHGDPRPDNMMMQRGAITALLDWEFVHPGDPSEDLQYAKGFVAPFVSWDEFLGAYLAAGGAPVSDAAKVFYDVFRSVRNLVCIDASWKGFVTGGYPSLKLAMQGIVYKRMLARELAQSLAHIAWQDC